MALTSPAQLLSAERRDGAKYKHLISGNGDHTHALTSSLLSGLSPFGFRHDEQMILEHIREGRFQRSLALITAFSSLLSGKHGIMGFTDSIHCELLHDKSNVKITMVQLPAVNTPQFGWVKSRLKNKAQPVPPIYEPEVIADAVTWITDHYRRELFIGLNTAIIIQGNKVFPALGDWYLGKTGYKSQQTNEPANPNRPNNVWEPVDETRDYGAHGAFDKQARRKSRQLWVDTHPGVLALAGSAGLLSIAGGVALFRKLQ